METYGQLKVRVYIAFSQDQYGRLDGRWRTIYSKWTERENVEQLLEHFTAGNAALMQSHVRDSRLRVTFETSEELRI